LGEALACCPELVLVPGDPVGVAQAWEEIVQALEGIGALVEPARPGLAFFGAAGLGALHGDIRGVLAATRRALGRPIRIGVGPTRFCALACALEARSRRAWVIGARDARRYLSSQPVSVLGFREQTSALVPILQRLGIGTLGDLAALSAEAIADRFGEPGIQARGLALGHDEPLRARQVEDRLSESMELAESSSGQALQRALEALIERLLARPQRRGRTIRALTLYARLVERGTWCERVVLREAISDRRRIRLALSLRLGLLPAPAQTLGLTVEQFGPAGGEQGVLLDGERAARMTRLRDAVVQVRAVAGPHAALRALPVDPCSRVPERRFAFTPWAV